MIRVVGANPAMDRIATWPPLRLGEVNRAASVAVVPGGKGFNVARAAIRLGSDATAYGFLGGPVGESLRGMIRADGVIDRHTTIAAGTRVCFIVVEPEPGRTTVLNEPGPAVTDAEVAHFTDLLAADCQAGDTVVLAGSLPDSVDPTVAAKVVSIGNAGRRTDLLGHPRRLPAGGRGRAALDAQVQPRRASWSPWGPPADVRPSSSATATCPWRPSRPRCWSFASEASRWSS